MGQFSLQLKGQFCLQLYSLAKLGQEEWDEAIKDCNKAIEIDPSDADAYFGRGCSKCKIGDIEGAVEDLKKAGEFGFDAAYEEIKRIQKH